MLPARLSVIGGDEAATSRRQLGRLRNSPVRILCNGGVDTENRGVRRGAASITLLWNVGRDVVQATEASARTGSYGPFIASIAAFVSASIHTGSVAAPAFPTSDFARFQMVS